MHQRIARAEQEIASVRVVIHERGVVKFYLSKYTRELTRELSVLASGGRGRSAHHGTRSKARGPPSGAFNAATGGWVRY